MRGWAKASGSSSPSCCVFEGHGPCLYHQLARSKEREREGPCCRGEGGGMQQLEPKWRMSNAGCLSGMHSNYEYHSLADSKLQRRSCDAKGSHCTHTHYGVITFAAAAGEPGCSLSLPIIIRRVVKSLPLFSIYIYILENSFLFETLGWEIFPSIEKVA